MSNYHVDTLCLQAGYTPQNGQSRLMPIIQSTTYKYDSSEQMGRLFDLEESGIFLYPPCKPDFGYGRRPHRCLGGRHRRNAYLFGTSCQLLRTLQHLRGRQPHRRRLGHLWRHAQPALHYAQKDGGSK